MLGIVLKLFNFIFYMLKQRSTKKVNHLSNAKGLDSLLLKMYAFRKKYMLNDASFGDIVCLYYYHSCTSKGCSLSMFTKQRYGAKTGYKAMRERLDRLIARGLVNQEKSLLYPSELALRDLAALVNP